MFIGICFKNKCLPTGLMMKGRYLQSASGAYKLILQQNGNLEIVCKNNSIWSTNTFDSDINSMRFDDLGIIGLGKSSSLRDVWSSMPGWQGSINPDSLIMQDDGNLIAFERDLISNEKRQIFATNSLGKCAAGNIFSFLQTILMVTYILEVKFGNIPVF